MAEPIRVTVLRGETAESLHRVHAVAVRDGKVEAIRAIRVARSSAVKARTQATNQLKAMIVTGSPRLRQQLRHLSTPLIIAHCARLRPSPDLGDPEQATKTALRRLARRHQQLSAEITEADRELHQLVRDVAPALLDLPGVGSEVAGQVLISIGDNADRLKSEAAFAHLCGAHQSPPAAAELIVTGSTAAVTAAQTTPST